MKNILYLLLFYIGAVKAQNITLLDSLTHYPISAVVIENSKGEIKGISNDKGQVNISNSSDIVYTSHLSYESKKLNVKNLKEKQEILLSHKIYELPEVILSKQQPDYILLKCYIRTYQYADSIPIYYTEGWIDFYLPKKGNKLQYNIIAIKAYENTKSKKLQVLKKSPLFMGNNGLFDFIANEHFPLDKNYSLKKKNEQQYSIVYRQQEGAGNIEKKNNEYTCYLNALFPKDSIRGSFAGRTNVIKHKDVYEKFPASIDFEAINSTDFSIYRCLIDIKTTFKKDAISLTNIFEIYPFLKEEKNKSEVKNVTLKSDFGNFFHSFNTTYFKNKQTPLQLSLPFESLLEKDLVLLPEKKK
jgi:hypothetical protein